MDIIFIENLTFWGRHGLLPHEKLQKQPFVIDIELRLDLTPSGVSDKLKDTLDYGEVKIIIQNIIEGKRANLIEYLGERICTELLKNPLIQSVKITLRKTRIWPEGVPGVIIERARA